MSIIALITAFLKAAIAWCDTAAIRERRELRTEARTLRHEIILAADSGDTRRLAELQNALADNERDRAALLAAASSASR
jgi:hypothetical protein